VSGGQAWVTTLDPGRSVIRFDLAPDETGQRSFAVALDGFVGAQAASDPDGVWVTDPDGGRVVRLDAAGQEVGEVAVGGEPGALVEGAGSLWVVNDADDAVIRIDPDTMTVVETLSVDGAADAITSTDEAIYITDREASSLTRIDVSDSTSRTTVDVARLPTDPQAGAGGLWLISPEAGTLHRYDFESLTEEQVVDVGGILGGLAIDGDDLWVTRPEAGELVKVTSSD
jgi:streptogramin lyase